MLGLLDILTCVFLAAYFADVGVHLRASARSDNVLRRQTKVWLMPTLLGAFACATASRGAWDAAAVLFAVTLAFYWAGDILLALAPSGSRKFVLGGLSFAVAHVLTIIALVLRANLSAGVFASIAPAIAASALLYAILVVIVARRLRTFLARKLKVPAVIYMAMNACMNLAAMLCALANPGLAGACLAAGAASFFISDGVLLSVRFNAKTRFRTHTLVMGTYLAAALLLSVGIVLMR